MIDNHEANPLSSPRLGGYRSVGRIPGRRGKYGDSGTILIAIDDITHRLAATPQMGPACHFRNPRLRGVRRFPVSGFEKWLVFYQSSDGDIEVVRVLHGARDIASILDPDPPRL